MKRITGIIGISALCAAAAAPAQGQVAQESSYFGGIAILAPGGTHLDTQGTRLKGKNDPLRFKLYGGVQLSRHFALEGGYAHFGKDRFKAPGGNIEIGTDLLYVAGRGTIAVGDSFELFARAGVSAQRYRMHGLPGAPDTKNGFSPMLGLGVGYKLTDKLTLTLEAEHFGRIRVDQRHFGRGGYSAGLNMRF